VVAAALARVERLQERRSNQPAASNNVLIASSNKSSSVSNTTVHGIGGDSQAVQWQHHRQHCNSKVIKNSDNHSSKLQTIATINWQHWQ